MPADLRVGLEVLTSTEFERLSPENAATIPTDNLPESRIEQGSSLRMLLPVWLVHFGL